jgi:hypothetical protein
MAVGYVDGVFFLASSSGTGNFVVSSAITGYQTPAAAGAVNGTTYYYRAQSNDLTQWEIGFGTYTVSSTTLARTTILFNSSGGTSAINFSAAPNVGIVHPAEQVPPADTTLDTGGGVNGLTTFRGAKTDMGVTPPMYPNQMLLGVAAPSFYFVAGSNGQATGTTMATSATSVGDSIFVAINAITANVAITSVTDNAGNTYTQQVQTTQTASVLSSAIYACLNAPNALSGSTGTITVNCAGTNYCAAVYALTGAGTMAKVGTALTFTSAAASTGCSQQYATQTSNILLIACPSLSASNTTTALNGWTMPGWLTPSFTSLTSALSSSFGPEIFWQYCAANLASQVFAPTWPSLTGMSSCVCAFSISTQSDPAPATMVGDVYTQQNGLNVVKNFNYGQSTPPTPLIDSNGGIDPNALPKMACVLDANYTLTSTTASQKLFNASSTGAVQLQPGVYIFQGLIYITSMSTTSGNAAINIVGAGTATLDSILWTLTGADTSTPTAVTTTGYSWVINTGNASPASGTLAETGSQWAVWFQGVLRMTNYGTLIPSVSLVTAAAAVVNKNSYFYIDALGTVGNVTATASTFGRNFGNNAWI